MQRVEREPVDYVLVGVLDEDAPMRVDEAGTLRPPEGGWIMEWWVRDGDRWCIPSQEPTVRQRRLGPGPVIETVMRVLGGDFAATVHPSPSRPPIETSVTVLELENRASTPVAVALVVRAAERPESSARRRARRGAVTGTRFVLDATAIGVEVVSGRSASISSALVTLPRSPSEMGVVPASPERLDEGIDGPFTGTAPDGAVAVFPLPHTARLQVTVRRQREAGVTRTSAAESVLDPPATRESVVAGWRQLVDGGGRVELPDSGLGDRVGAARARLLLGSAEIRSAVQNLAPGAGPALMALATSGALGDARRAIVALTDSPRFRVADAAASAEIVRAAGVALELLRDSALAADSLSALVTLGQLVDRLSRPDPLVADGLARAANAAGQSDAAAHLRTTDASPGPLGFDGVVRLAETASSAGAFGPDDLLPAARLWMGVRDILVAESTDGLDLLPEFPTAWRGGPLEVHRLVTSFGRLSFAIRWHGFRPALLWSIEDLAEGVTLRLRCPGLDPGWEATSPRGETLLAGLADSLPAPPRPGESFA